MRLRQEITQKELLWSRWFLVQKLWDFWKQKEQKVRPHVVRGYPGLQIKIGVQECSRQLSRDERR
jgi:hypothetical protein